MTNPIYDLWMAFALRYDFYAFLFPCFLISFLITLFVYNFHRHNKHGWALFTVLVGMILGSFTLAIIMIPLWFSTGPALP